MLPVDDSVLYQYQPLDNEPEISVVACDPRQLLCMIIMSLVVMALALLAFNWSEDICHLAQDFHNVTSYFELSDFDSIQIGGTLYGLSVVSYVSSNQTVKIEHLERDTFHFNEYFFSAEIENRILNITMNPRQGFNSVCRMYFLRIFIPSDPRDGSESLVPTLKHLNVVPSRMHPSAQLVPIDIGPFANTNVTFDSVYVSAQHQLYANSLQLGTFDIHGPAQVDKISCDLYHNGSKQEVSIEVDEASTDIEVGHIADCHVTVTARKSDVHLSVTSTFAGQFDLETFNGYVDVSDCHNITVQQAYDRYAHHKRGVIFENEEGVYELKVHVYGSGDISLMTLPDSSI